MSPYIGQLSCYWYKMPSTHILKEERINLAPGQNIQVGWFYCCVEVRWNSIAERCGRAKLLTSWRPGSTKWRKSIHERQTLKRHKPSAQPSSSTFSHEHQRLNPPMSVALHDPISSPGVSLSRHVKFDHHTPTRVNCERCLLLTLN